MKQFDGETLKDLKRFFFGIGLHNKIDYQGSMFERILSTPKSSTLIRLVRKKFEFLGTSEEILILVRNFILFLGINNFTFL